MKKLLLLIMPLLLFGFSFALSPSDGDARRSRPLPLDYYSNPIAMCHRNFPDDTEATCNAYGGMRFSATVTFYSNRPELQAPVGVPYPFRGQQIEQPSETQLFDPYDFSYCNGGSESSDEDKTIVNWMYDNGMTMYTDPCDFAPGKTINREQATKFYGVFAKNIMGKTEDMSKPCIFSDINEADPTLQASIISACRLGILKGYNGKIMPKDTLDLPQAETMFIRIIIGMLPEDGVHYYDSYHAVGSQLGYFAKYFKNTSAKRGVIAGYFYKYSHPDRDNGMDDSFLPAEL